MRPRLLHAIVTASALAPLGRGAPAHADWDVRRTGDRGLVEQAARALAARPEDGALAARLVRLAGKSRAPALRARFEAPARPPDARYAEVAAYATILLALGANEDAAAAFARAAALRPELAMLTGRARALERAGRPADALAAYDDALARARAPAERRRLLEAEIPLLPPGDSERELALRRALATLEPRSEDAAARVADVLERLGRPAEAAELLEARAA
ncbi:MAG TPA: hypothetical protein VMT47_01910, partial [Polyangia bacterium]|nr:hypothetical protein [Polyangia bacterium]